jgi:peptidoglycan/LPS O-acetylase OafA/YrhL
MKKSIIGAIAATFGLLLIPLIAMQFSHAWNWDMTDFMVMGILVFVTSLLIGLVLEKVRSKTYRVLITIGLVAAFLVIWTELAVGIFN